ncbi:gtpase-activating protein [Stylonychia lemnae]|uniref:Gtpase-activating protein n=1 Tax=Stylonychia lemnae TaxID=5949 RepID=A0A078AND1_STYLE|nr:gtpase-activating protein [Stylonychia lemnae]|eukprot:CDW83411.1 gtpase-activating protein [Stylonychia lemnae]
MLDKNIKSGDSYKFKLLKLKKFQSEVPIDEDAFKFPSTNTNLTYNSLDLRQLDNENKKKLESRDKEELKSFQTTRGQRERKAISAARKLQEMEERIRTLKPKASLKKKNSITQDDALRMIIDRDINYFSKKVKSALTQLWNDDYQFNSRQRRRLWLVLSGAQQQLSSKLSQDNYKNLKNLKLRYPNPCFNQIDLDLKRTQMDLGLRSDNFLSQLRNILVSYVKRNPSIGYCQGMNFIVAKFLTIMSEQESFETFTQIIESILPIDYYTNMVGILIDQKVLKYYIQDLMPQLFEHLDTIKFDPSLFIFQWFVCLFSNNINYDIQNKIMDLFFIKGSKALFWVSIAIIYNLKQQLLESSDFQTSQLIDGVKKVCRFVKGKRITQLREEFRPLVEKELQETIDQKETLNQGQYLKFQFINRFYLYPGLHKFYNLNENSQQLSCQNVEQFNNKLFNYFHCDPKWPVCLYDYTYKNKIPNYLCFKIASELTQFIKTDYFYPNQNENLDSDQILQKILNEELKLKELKDQILIERNEHMCTNQYDSHQEFEMKFKYLLSEKCESFSHLPSFQININDQMSMLRCKEDLIMIVSCTQVEPDFIRKQKEKENQSYQISTRESQMNKQRIKDIILRNIEIPPSLSKRSTSVSSGERMIEILRFKSYPSNVKSEIMISKIRARQQSC